MFCVCDFFFVFILAGGVLGYGELPADGLARQSSVEVKQYIVKAKGYLDPTFLPLFHVQLVG